jgi:Raf kinase inhibitor-like YbhB/YbcL family protein
MRTAWRAATLLLVAAVIAGAVYLIVPDRSENQPAKVAEVLKMENKLTLKSIAFGSGETIPSKYTCDGENINPPLSISGVPEGTVSLALIMDDPDIPQQFKDDRGIDSFDHWAVYNISPELTNITEGVEPEGSVGENGRGDTGYTGPCPPPEFEPTEHRYFFKLYVLDSEFSFDATPTKGELIAAMEGHIISQTELVGLYDRAGTVSE